MLPPGDDEPGIELEPLWLLLADLQRALEEEIDAVRRDLARRGLTDPVTAVTVRSRREAGAGFRYAVQLPGGAFDIRIEDRVRVRTADRETLGLVLAHERRSGVLTLYVPDWLGERPSGLELEFDPTWILRELSARLDEIAERPGAFHPRTVLSLLGRHPPRIGRGVPELDTSSELNEPQRAALERLLGSDAQLVWGPPGTGKSRLVARSALELAREGRVLIAATTNGAVDELAGRLAAIADPEALRANRIIRVGSEPGRAEPGQLSLEAAVSARIAAGAGGVARGLEDLERSFRLERAAGNGASPTPHVRAAFVLAAARSRGDGEGARAVGRLLAEMGRQAVRALEEANIVLTTLARLAVREELRPLRFDALMIDEASTAPLPYVALAAAVTGRRAFAVGDFQQLPPVISSDGPAARRWLRTDVFRETGVVPGGASAFALPSPGDRLCAMLDVQYRMDPAIRALVGEFFYGGRLRDAPEVGARRRAAEPLLLADTSRLAPNVERPGGSRRNAVHAEIVLDLIERLAREGETEIGVVTPYRAQTRRIRDLVRGRLGQAAPPGLEVSTIHRFQGREKDVVLFDTVDAPPGRSWFLDERRNPDFPRLLNVALSRARGRLVVVASVDGLGRTLPGDALLVRLLRRMEQSGVRIVPSPASERASPQNRAV